MEAIKKIIYTEAEKKIIKDFLNLAAETSLELGGDVFFGSSDFDESITMLEDFFEGFSNLED